jgi:hypothetical protein
LSQLNELLKNPQPKTKADCTDTKTPIPVSVFSSESMKVYDQLCNDWAKDKERSMTVDSGGKSVKPEPHLRKRMKVDAGTYRDWMFDLSFRPVKGDDKCTMNCREAFEHMSRACATFRKFHLRVPEYPELIKVSSSSQPLIYSCLNSAH